MTQNWKKEYPAEMEPYIKKCLLLTWMMTVQDPPMCFARAMEDGMKEKVLNTSMYKWYLSSGTRIAYTVWPCLLLHKDGHLVAKGVVEGSNDENKC